MRRLAVIACAAAACGGGTKRVHKPGDEYLTAIRIEGNRAIETDDLEPGLALHRNQLAERTADPYQLTVDTERIRAAYLKLGFFDVKVTSRVDRATSGAQTAVFVVVEGKRAKARVAITGLPPEVSFERARGTVELADGAPFDYEAYDDAKEPLVALVENAGYAHVDLSATVLGDRRNGIAILQYVIDAGLPCTFGAVKLSGVPDRLVDPVLGRLTFKQGDRYSRETLAATQRSLYELGRFATVRITPDTSSGDGVVPVSIEVTEQSRHELKLGGGAGYEPLTWELRTRAAFGVVPEAFPLWRLGTEARVAVTAPHTSGPFDADFGELEPKVRLLGTATRTDLFRPRLTGEIEGGLDYLTVEAYTTTGGRLRLGLSKPLVGSWLQVRVGYLLQSLKFTKISNYISEAVKPEYGLDHRERIGAYQQSLIADLRDNAIAPRRGFYLAMMATEGTKYAGSKYEYLQLSPDVRAYHALGPDTVIAVRARVGAILGHVPVTERYFSGGQTQRGFSERHLAPSIFGVAMDGTEGSVVIGGAGLIETSIELRQKLFDVGFPVGLNLFLDGGDVTDKPEQLDPTDLHWAAGAGLWASFGGLKVRLEAGFRLNRRGSNEPEPDSSWAGHLGVGESY